MGSSPGSWGWKDPGQLRFLAKARELGLGEFSPEATELIGELRPIPNFKLPPLGGEAMSRAPQIQEFIESRTRAAPQGRSGQVHRLRGLHRALPGLGPGL